MKSFLFSTSGFYFEKPLLILIFENIMKMLTRLVFVLILASIFCDAESGVAYIDQSTEISARNGAHDDNSNKADSPFCFDNQTDDNPFFITEFSISHSSYVFPGFHIIIMPETKEFSPSVWQPPKSA
jgi:hypothetical protein